MTRPATDVFEDALALSEEDRGRLAERLLASLDAGEELDGAGAWAVEIERRLIAIASGEMPSVTMQEALDRLHRAARGR